MKTAQNNCYGYKWRETTNFFVEVINSKRKSKRNLGHVVQIQVGCLPYTWLWISLLNVLKHESFYIYNKYTHSITIESNPKAIAERFTAYSFNISQTMLRSSLQSPFCIISFSILQKKTFKRWPRLTWPMILKYEEMKNKKMIYRRTAILEQNVEYIIFGTGNTIHFTDWRVINE